MNQNNRFQGDFGMGKIQSMKTGNSYFKTPYVFSNELKSKKKHCKSKNKVLQPKFSKTHSTLSFDYKKLERAKKLISNQSTKKIIRNQSSWSKKFLKFKSGNNSSDYFLSNQMIKDGSSYYTGNFVYIIYQV